jgi:hypothetical protein
MPSRPRSRAARRCARLGGACRLAEQRSFWPSRPSWRTPSSLCRNIPTIMGSAVAEILPTRGLATPPSQRDPPRAWSTFGPHTIGAQRFIAVSSGASFAQVAGTILGKQAWVENPDKDEAAGSSPARPTIPPLTSGNACHVAPSIAAASVSRVSTAVSERIQHCCPWTISGRA